MKNILVPCDFSKPAVNALRFALDVAAQSKGTVHLLYVIELPVLHDTVIMPVLYFEDTYFKDMKADSAKRFEKLLAKYNNGKVKVIYKVEFGPITKTIIEYSVKNKIDLTVMGSHGTEGLQGHFIGSTAEKIVRSSSEPVLIIKDLFKGILKSIVFPNALQDVDQKALATKVKSLQEFFKAQLHIVWINTPTNFAVDTITYSKLEAFAKRYAFKNYTIAVFNHTNEEEGIIHYTQMIKGNLIALGTQGRKGIAHLMYKSIAEDVVNHSHSLIWTSKVKEKSEEK